MLVVNSKERFVIIEHWIRRLERWNSKTAEDFFSYLGWLGGGIIKTLGIAETATIDWSIISETLQKGGAET